MIPEGINFTVYWLVDARGNIPVEEYLLSLQANEAFFTSAVDSLAKLRKSENHKKPLTKKMKGKHAAKIFEVRIMGGPNKELARIMFCYLPGRKVVLLYGFTKKDGDPPPEFIKRACVLREKIIKGELHYEKADIPEVL